jgi:hypothetical protein
MKNSIIFSLVVLVFVSFAFVPMNDQDHKNEHKTNRVPLKKLEGSKVSEQTKANFNAQFGNVPDVHWTRTQNFDEAVFSNNGKKMNAWFDDLENMVGSTSQVSFTDLPAKGQKTIKSKYKDYMIRNVILFLDNEANATDMILYGEQFDDADNYFVELAKDKDHIVVMVNTVGEVTFFKHL